MEWDSDQEQLAQDRVAENSVIKMTQEEKGRCLQYQTLKESSILQFFFQTSMRLKLLVSGIAFTSNTRIGDLITSPASVNCDAFLSWQILQGSALALY